MAIKMDVPCVMSVCDDVSVSWFTFYEESLNPGFNEHDNTTCGVTKKKPLRCSMLDMFSRRFIFSHFWTSRSLKCSKIASSMNYPATTCMVHMKPRKSEGSSNQLFYRTNAYKSAYKCQEITNNDGEEAIFLAFSPAFNSLIDGPWPWSSTTQVSRISPWCSEFSIPGLSGCLGALLRHGVASANTLR